MVNKAILVSNDLFAKVCTHCTALNVVCKCVSVVTMFILLHKKFLQFDWLRAVVFQLTLKYLHVKITKPLRVVV